jgi:hypothetical protein
MSAEVLRQAADGLRDEWGANGPTLGSAWHRERDLHLAVADWLDGVALFVEARDDEEMFDLDGDPIAPEDTHAIGSALKVARAYLGESS